MTLAEVKSLLDAGFTKDEIMAFETPAQNPEPVPADPEPAPAEEQTQETVSTPDINPAIEKLDSTISKLIKTIQSSNLANNHTDSVAADLNKQVDTIMNSIIRPIKEGKQ